MKTQSTEHRPTGICSEKPLVVDTSIAFGSDACKATLGSFWRTILRRILVWCVYTGRHRENENLAEERLWLAWVPKRILRYLRGARPIQRPASNLESQNRPTIATESASDALGYCEAAKPRCVELDANAQPIESVAPAVSGSIGSDRFGELRIPEEMSRVILHLEQCYGVRAFDLLPASLAVVGMAMGRATIEVPNLPWPVSPAMHCAIWDPSDSAIWAAVQDLLRPLRDIEVAQFATMRSCAAADPDAEIQKVERERAAYFAFNPVRDPAAELIFNDRIKSIREQQPSALLVESPTAGSLRRLLSQQAESSSLVVYSKDAFSRVLAKGTSRWVKDLDILAESASSSLNLCDSEALGKLFQAENRFADQLIVSTPAAAPGRAHSDPAPKPISGWSSLLARLVEQRRLGKTQPIRLSGDAVEMLGAVRNRKVLLFASKIALQLNGGSLPHEAEIPTRVMQAAMAIATTLIERSDEIVKDVLTRQTDAEIRRDAAVMLRKIQDRGAIRQRTLHRRYWRQSKQRHAPALKLLLQSGQVRERADNLLEATTSPSVGLHSHTSF